MGMFTQSWIPTELCPNCESDLETQEEYDEDDNLVEVCCNCRAFISFL